MKKLREDFPDLLSPMLVKELRQGMRTKTFVSAFVVLQVLMVIMMSLSAMDYGNNPDAFRIKELNGMFWGLCGILLLLVMPLRGVVAVSSEEKAKTLELIFLTRLTSWRIVLGKWASLMFQSVLFALAVLPYAVLRYFFGNVNLLDDLLVLASLLWMSSLLTTAMVGISGFSGFLKGALLVIVGFFGLPAIGVLLELLFGSGMALRGMRFGGTPESMIWVLLIADSIIMGFYFLEMAASQIAPDAENHMLRKRGLALLTLLIAAILCFSGAGQDIALFQFLLGAMALGFCSAEALCSQRPVMQSHVEDFALRGKAAAWIGRFFYPGWPSGAAFAFLSAGLLILVFWTVPGLDTNDRLRGFVAILLGVSALLTPLVIFSIIMKRWRQSLAPFFIVQVTFMVVAIFAFAAAEITKQRFPIHAMLPLPPSSFWVIIFQGVKDEELELFAASAGISGILCFALLFFWSYPFWKRVREMEDLARARKADKVSAAPAQDPGPVEGA